MVQIPNGNYSNPKYIINKKVQNGEEYRFNLKFPFNDFIGLRRLSSENYDDILSSNEYWANYPELYSARTEQEKNERLNERQAILDTPIWKWENLNGSTTFDTTRLGIQADWKVLLSKYHPIRGTYGFKIVITGVSGSTDTTTSVEKEVIHYFTNKDMYGNTYSFNVPYNQQKVIDISEFLNIHSIVIYFIQDFDFTDQLNKIITYDLDESKRPPNIPPNIVFTNLFVALGVSAEDIKQDTALIYTYDSKSYTGLEEIVYDEETGVRIGSKWSCEDQKNINISWVHHEKDRYSVIDDQEKLYTQRDRSNKSKTHVFWYRYDYKATDEENIFPNQDIEYDNEEWPLLDVYTDWIAEQDPVIDSVSDMTRYGGVNWTFLPYATDQFNFILNPRGDKSREKLKVVIQHDGIHTTSKEIIFRNTRDIDGEVSTNARNDFVVLKTFKLKKTLNDDKEWTGSYSAIEDGSVNAFYIYDENNKVLIGEDGISLAQKNYYLQIQVRNADTNKYEPLKCYTSNLNGVIVPTGTDISWSFPRTYSMINSYSYVDQYDALYFGIDPINDIERYENFKQNTIKFTVASSFNNRNLDNTIGAIITRADKEYYIKKEFLFGRAQGLGHDFLPVIEVLYPYGDPCLIAGSTAEFLIGCAVYNKDGTLHDAPSTLSFNWKELSNKSNLVYSISQDSEELEGYQITDYFSAVAEDERDESFISKYRGYQGNVIKARLKASLDGIIYPPIFEVTVNNAASYPLTVRKSFMVCTDSSYKQARHITVPNRIEFKSDGANPIFYNGKFNIDAYVENENKEIEYIKEYPEWNINNNKLFNLQPHAVYDENHTEIGTTYSLRFNINGRPQWTDELLKEDYYTYLYYTSNEGIYVAQSLSFDRNYYSSSLVNDWDGASLTWDNENGAILSTMIAAGVKDNNNKFTGIMMGDWHTRGDESLDVPGLYGYDKGKQSFGFKTDGTGFIGNSGGGRIEFDGNRALITNASETCYINLNPKQRSFTNSNTDSYSSNFLYCKTPKDKSFIDNLYTITDTHWASQYFNDDQHDYFIIDPNYGIASTGGIIARYGKIGNWNIGETGLYQRDSKNQKYMHLGYSSMSESEYQSALNDAHEEYIQDLTDEDLRYQKVMNKIDKQYKNRLDAALQNRIDMSELTCWFDLLHYRSIGIGLSLVRQFLNECLNSEDNNYLTYFKNNVSRVIGNAANESQHDFYNWDEYKVEQHRSGYNITMNSILQAVDNNVCTFNTFYNNDVYVNVINKNNIDNYTKEDFENIIAQCDIGYIIFEEAYQLELSNAKIQYAIKAAELSSHEYSNEESIHQINIQTIENKYNNARNEAEALYSENGRVYCIYAGSKEIDEAFTTTTDPYFSVTWDGTLYARKGKIAKTWDIDDTSLQYRKNLTDEENFDKIYMGQGNKNTSIIDPVIDSIINAGKNVQYVETYIDEDTKEEKTRNFYYGIIKSGDTYKLYKVYTIVKQNNKIYGKNLQGNYITDNNNNKLEFTNLNQSSTPKVDAQRWAISAGTVTKDKNYINFGVTQAGELYSQLGTIGGWKIDQSNLRSLNNVMRLNASQGQIYVGEFINKQNQNDAVIIIDGTTGTIRLNHQFTDGEEDYNTAQIWMAGYILAAKTEKSVTYPRISSSDSKADLSNIISGSTGSTSKAPNNWYSYGGSSLASSMTIASTNYTVITNDKSFNNVDIFQIVSQTDATGNYGINLATGSSEGIKTVAFYPVGCTKKYPVLGQKGALWNLYANEIDCVTLNNAGTIAAKMFVMDHETVATEPWVYKQLQGIWNALNKTNGEVGGLSDGLGGLAGNVNDKCVTSLDWSGTSATSGKVDFTIAFYRTLGGNVSRGSEKAPHSVALATHGHKLTINGTTLSLAAEVVGTDQTVKLSHNHKVSGSMSADGKLTVTVGDANFTEATGEYTIDCSAWLEAAKKQGWEEAAEGCGLNSLTNSVKYPTSTYGIHDTKTAKAHASIDDNCDATADSFTIEVGDIGSTAYGAPRHTGGAWIDDTWITWS